MFDTLDHVAAAGFTWFGDWVLDDQPIWVKTAHGPLLAVPYSAEINDITMMVSHHHEFDVLFSAPGTRSTGSIPRARSRRASSPSACILMSPDKRTASNISSSSIRTSTSIRAWCIGPASRSTTGT